MSPPSGASTDSKTAGAGAGELLKSSEQAYFASLEPQKPHEINSSRFLPSQFDLQPCFNETGKSTFDISQCLRPSDTSIQCSDRTRFIMLSSHFGDDLPAIESYNSSRASELVLKAMQQRIETIEQATDLLDEGESFLVADLGYLTRQCSLWNKNLSRIRPFYAVKCNPAPLMIKFLASHGIGFDCASIFELELALSAGARSTDIVFANPCKSRAHLRYARKHRISKMTFDNSDELYKIQKLYPEAKLLLRTNAGDPTAAYRLSEKFGATIETAKELLRLARVLNLNVTGIAFHIGSNATNPHTFKLAIAEARELFDYGLSLQHPMDTLDIGGGLSEATFTEMASAINFSLDMYFPRDVNIIAEPGRFFVEGAMTLACNIVARRVPDKTSGAYRIYLNDGVYGMFSNVLHEPDTAAPHILRIGGRFVNTVNQLARNSATKKIPLKAYSIWGATCCGLDLIKKDAYFSEALLIGDWLYFPNMGAYTTALTTSFNGFDSNRHIVYVGSETFGQRFLMENYNEC